jgi:hypothetical protein
LFEAGHELYPGPLCSTASATAALAGASARPDVADALLAIATEGAVASLAVPAADVQGGCGVTLDGALLRGTARAVPHGASAAILVAVADTPAGASLVLVQPAALELATRRPRAGIDFITAYADLVLDGVPGTVISDDPRQVSHVLDLAQVSGRRPARWTAPSTTSRSASSSTA